MGPLIFFKSTAYKIAFIPDVADQSYTHKLEFIQIANVRNEAERRWNVIVAEEIGKNAHMTDADDSDEIIDTVDITGASTDVVSTDFVEYEYAGQAHGQAQSHMLVWSLRYNRALTLADLFTHTDSGKALIARRSMSHFDPSVGSDEGRTQEAVRGTLDWIDANQIWYIAPYGLGLLYAPYAFGCYPCDGQALIPWAELAPALKHQLPFAIKDLQNTWAEPTQGAP